MNDQREASAGMEERGAGSKLSLGPSEDEDDLDDDFIMEELPDTSDGDDESSGDSDSSGALDYEPESAQRRAKQR